MLTAFLLTLALATPQPVCATLDIRAQLADDLQSIVGTATCHTQFPGPWRVAAYPRLLRTPTGMDDVSQLWTYPEGFDAADMQLSRADVPLQGEGAWQAVGSAQDAAGAVTINFSTRIPNRNGALGQRHGVAYLLGGWHPVWARNNQLDRTHIRYSVTVPASTVGFAGAQPFGHSSSHLLTGDFTGRFLPILVAPAAAVRVENDAILIAPLDRRGNPAGHRDVTSGLDAAAYEQIMGTLMEGAAFARKQGVRTRPTIAVVTPLRHRLIEPFDGGLAVSDHAFHLLPFERIRKFHRAVLWREQLTSLVMRHAARNENILPPELAADAVAGAWQAGLMRERYGANEYAPDLLETFAVIPEIDALIFAPQVPFVEAYYNAIDETPLSRLRFDDFYHGLPRGKLLYEKLRDSWGEEATQNAVKAYLAGKEDFFTCATDAGPANASALLAPWLGPYPVLNYTLAKIEHGPHGTHVEIGVEGPAAGQVTEPIEVRVKGANDTSVSLQRLGPGPLDIAVDNPRVVELDPQNRLGELYHAPGLSPRYDNRSPQRWRWLLNNISGLVAVTNAQLSASADVSLRRIYDLRFGFDFFALYSPTALGLAATGTYNFGHELTPLRLSDSFNLSIEYDRLLVGGGATLPGQEISTSFSYNSDSRLSPYFDFDGEAFSTGIGAGYAKDSTGRHYLYTQLNAAGLKILPLAFGHALVGRLRYDYTLGDAPVQDLLPLGGRYFGARGYEIDEARSKQRGIISAEYRHVLSGGNRTDFWGALMVTRVDGALFADAVYLPHHTGGCDRDMFYDVGYGVRFIGDILNVSPTSLQIDVGVPLSRCANTTKNIPVSIYVGILQSFSNY